MSNNGFYNQQSNYYQNPQQQGNGLGTASLVLGIIAIVGSWIPFLNVLSLIFAIVALGLGIPGLIIGIIHTRPKGPAIAGLILGIISIIIFIATNTLYLTALKIL